MKKEHLPLLIIGLSFVVFSIVQSILPRYPDLAQIPVNSTPLAALFFCGVLFSGRAGGYLCFALFLLAYPVLTLIQGYTLGWDFPATLVAFTLISGVAYKLREYTPQGGKKLLLLVGGSMACAAMYYFMTNTASWLALPFYEKSLTGFYQAQWGQAPGLPLPTWVFLRNSLIGNGLFALLICLAHWKVNFKPSLAPSPAIN